MAYAAPVIHAVGEVLTASDWNIGSNDLIFLYGDTAWTAATLTNGWGNLGSGYQVAGYRKVGTRVWLRGVISGGTSGSIAFTLPALYRPLDIELFATWDATAASSLTVGSNGAVTITTGGSGVQASLSGISFDTI